MNETEAYAAFERDVPESMRENILQAICEAAHDDSYKDEHVTILDRDHLDAINVRANGYVTIGDNEFRFIVESGNRCGFVLEDWEGDTKFEHHTPTQWALAPNQHLVDDAIAKGQGPFLIKKWDILVKRPGISEIPGKYAYDRHFQPGWRTEKYWTAEADKHQMILVTADHAMEIRRRLESATKALDWPL